MGKQHELLAVEGNLQGAAKKAVEDTIKAFTSNVDHFQGHVKTLTMFDDQQQAQEGGVTDRKELVATVDEKLAASMEHVCKYYDAVLQKECTNQNARADLVVNGIVIGKDLPATFLLGLETKLNSLRAMFAAAPTLQAGVKWEQDLAEKEGIFKSAHPVETFKTHKTIMHKVTYEATPDHPAQVAAWHEDSKIGKYSTEQSSGMLTAAKKSKLLARLDMLIQAVKKARQRANNIDVVHAEIGDSIFVYIMG